MITLGNRIKKISGVRDFSPDSSSWRVPHSQINLRFSQSGQNFSRFAFFWFFKAQRPKGGGPLGEKKYFFKKCLKFWPKWSQLTRKVVLIPKMYRSKSKYVRIKGSCTIHVSVQPCTPCKACMGWKDAVSRSRPYNIYISWLSSTFLIIWDCFGPHWWHFLKKYFFSPKGPPFGFWALKNQKNPNCEKFWPDWAKQLFIWL